MAGRARRREAALAYPLRPEDFLLVQEASKIRGARPFVVTLAPPIDVVLKDRGARKLSEEERARIREMYEEGYAGRDFSDMVVTDIESPDAVARRIATKVMPPDAA